MRRALLIASANFDADSGITPLRFPGRDIAAIAKVLRSDDFAFEVQTLEDQPKSVVLRTLDAWMRTQYFDDLHLIYFSGHGLLNRTRELFLTCRDTKTEDLNVSGVKYEHIAELISEHSIQKVAVILDCCYAGKAVIGGKSTEKGVVEEQVRSAISDTGRGSGHGRGIFVLGASGASQTAEEREGDGHGWLTKHIIEGLETGAADIDDDGEISATDLATYVKRELRRQGADQEPIERRSFQGELILGSNRRKKFLLSVTAIQKALDFNRSNHFQIQTFRDIEDYLREIVQPTQNIEDVLSDERFMGLRSYSLGEMGSIERIVRGFLFLQMSSAAHGSRPAGAQSAQPEPESGPAEASQPQPSRSTRAFDRIKKRVELKYDKLKQSRPKKARASPKKAVGPTQTPPVPPDEKDDDINLKRALVSRLAAAVKGASGVYVAPNIPEKKERNAKRACGIPVPEEFQILFDFTVFGSAKNFISVGPKGVFYRSTYGKGLISHDELSRVNIIDVSTGIRLGDKR